MQFIICNKPSWWLDAKVKRSKNKGKGKCKTSGEVNEKALQWFADLMGEDCNGKTSASYMAVTSVVLLTLTA